MSGSSVWPILPDDDTRAALPRRRVGFPEAGGVVGSDSDADVVHAEMGWPGGVVLVFGSTKQVDSVHGATRAGSSALYVITDDATPSTNA